MAVNFPSIEISDLHPIAGLRLGYAKANIFSPERNDVLIFALDEGASVSGVFTTNRFCAAPVVVSRAHLQQMRTQGTNIRALVVNAGNANAGMGELGLRHANQTCETLAEIAHILPAQVLPFSTGIILEPLPIERLSAALPHAWASRAATSSDWYEAAKTIMTTDTHPKAASRQVLIDGHLITLTGISKGSGMIQPNMATMLGFIATDAAISQPVLDGLIKEVADLSFHSITVDGDTSTNDSFMIMATGRAMLPEISSTDHPVYGALREALVELAQTLALMIVRDGEGATKFVRIIVEQGKSVEECRKVAKAIAHSPLVKTALFASDPNLGRILCAVGYAGVEDLMPDDVDFYLDDLLVVKSGQLYSDYVESKAQCAMQKSEITLRIVLSRGAACTTVWTCDLSHEYIRINADYRS